MMNNIYDLSEIQNLRINEHNLIFRYVIYIICFIVILGLLCITVENNLLLTVIFALILLSFILFSILFWKIKYGIINKYKSFLDDLETGKTDDYVGVYSGRVITEDEELSSIGYVFLSSGKEKTFLVLGQDAICFEEGKKYHLVHIGDYLYQWEILE